MLSSIVCCILRVGPPKLKRVKRIVMDLDNTISFNGPDGNYEDAIPDSNIINKLKEYKSLNYEIVIYTSRNVRTFNGNVGKINVHTLPIIIDWLKKHEVPFDEIIVGKPWCGEDGFYVDDRSVRPSEFKNLSTSEISKLLKGEP